MSSTSYGQNFNTKYELSTDSATMACKPDHNDLLFLKVYHLQHSKLLQDITKF